MTRKRNRNNIDLAERDLEEILFAKERPQRSGLVSNKNELSHSASDNRVSSWQDSDDEDIEVSLRKTDRLRKMVKQNDGKEAISGSELSALLQERFKTKHLEWATVPSSNTTAEDLYGASYDNLVGEAGTLVSKAKKVIGFANGKINIRRLADANVAEPSLDPIHAVDFHLSSDLLLAAGADRSLRVFRVNGDTNPQQICVRFNEMKLVDALFRGRSHEVVTVGRKPFFFGYDTESGAITKITGSRSRSRSTENYERMAISPDGSRLAFAGGSGGYAHIFNGNDKTWMMELKTSSPLRAMTFASDRVLITSGLDADVLIWDLRHTACCLDRFSHEDGTCTSSIAVTATGDHLAVGAESGVVSLYRFDGSSTSPRKPMKSFMNLTTKIDSLSFHPSGRLMAMGSSQMSDQLRLADVNKSAIFTNWPTDKTPIRKLQRVSFSPNGAYFAACNNKGKVLLYKLNDFCDR